MAREHDWSYGTCSRCGHSTDLSGVPIEDAPPCVADPEDADIETLIDNILDAYGVFPDDIPRLDPEKAREKARQLIRDFTEDL